MHGGNVYEVRRALCQPVCERAAMHPDCRPQRPPQSRECAAVTDTSDGADGHDGTRRRFPV